MHDGGLTGGDAAGDPPSPRTPPDVRPDVILIWQTLASRRIAYDTMMWQTPALGMTAQAFLLTLALGGQESALGRAIAAALSAVLAIITLQLMGKHRHSELRDARQLGRIEHDNQFDQVVGTALHAFQRAQVRGGIGPATLARRFRAYSSFRLWMGGQVAFLIVDALILGLILSGRADLLTAS
jgi:hypothetical protein